MGELILYVIPAFVLLLAVELESFRLAADADLVGYEALRVRLAGGGESAGVKFLLVPFAIVAFVLFLLLLGAIGLAISMAVLGVVGRVWRFLSGADRHQRRPRQQA